MLNATVLTDRFDRALLYATHVHGGQVRKGTSIPYVAHLLAVAATVFEYGGSEDMAIAALLQDAVEDQGGKPRQKVCPATGISIWRCNALRRPRGLVTQGREVAPTGAVTST